MAIVGGARLTPYAWNVVEGDQVQGIVSRYAGPDLRGKGLWCYEVHGERFRGYSETRAGAVRDLIAECRELQPVLVGG
jgi:hypothetical protein